MAANVAIAYLVTNKVTNKSYVGITTRTLQRRWYEHRFVKNSSARLLAKSIQKHGEEAFEIKQIASSITGIDGLKAMEVVLINQYNTFVPNGYNLTKGGDGVFGFKHSKESCERQSVSRKNKKHSEETKQKMSEVRLGEKNHFFGRSHSEETKAKIALAKKNKPGPWRGKKRDEETGRKISLARKGKPGHKHTEEARRKISLAQAGQKRSPLSEETRQKISEAIRASWVIRRQQSEKGVHHGR